MKLFYCRQALIFIMVMIIPFSFGCSSLSTVVPPPPSNTPSTSTVIPDENMRSISILVDDFKPQPYEGESVYYFNRLEGDRGTLNNSEATWGDGSVTTTISSGNSWGGLWMSLNHPARENLSVNFSAVLPPQIPPEYQCQITGITIQIAGATQGKIFRVELKNKNELQWTEEIILSGDQQTMSFELPVLGDISQIVLVLDKASPGDFVIIKNISFSAKTPVTDTATAAFIWSYGMLLNNWDPATGLVRDKAKDPSGSFDAIQSTGSLATATAIAEQLNVVSHQDAILIVEKISDVLLLHTPRFHGLLPHWVKASDGGFVIVEETEWSTVDTAIATFGLLGAQNALGLDTSGVEKLLREIDWNQLVSPNGISHGYTYNGDLIPYTWDTFGGESWLVELAYASATGNIAPLSYTSPPTANGSGFIDELAWLYILPPSKTDYWGTDWRSYRAASAKKQISYYLKNGTSSCPTQLGLFGLSAAEVPVPDQVLQKDIYQAFGMGGQFALLNDGTAVIAESPVIVPHYSAMIALLHPQAAIKMWDWLIINGYFSPLNNVESLTFPFSSNCTPIDTGWNQLKGSWNLALQTLGWGHYLVEREGSFPAIWQATWENQLLQKGYLLLAPNESLNHSISTDPSFLLENTSFTCEGGSEYTQGLPGIYRYQIIDDLGNLNYYSVNLLSENWGIDYDSALGWPPRDSSIPPWTASTMNSSMENINTRLGNFTALRLDTILEYYVQTPNHSDPSGTVNRSEWFVCGIGLMRATMNHNGIYQTREFERQYDLELISFMPFP